ncbi:hypothetical protein DINM_021107 [Dirofilaria immitis]|nr:hypothetical protein [Dirofilaria immitis]
MEMEEKAILCPICLGPGSWPKARPKVCKHIFCYQCISAWVKKRSECPLCKRPARILIVINQDGKEYKISVKEKTAVQYQSEIDEEYINLFQEAEDITVAYARCQLPLLLFAGKTQNVPEGDWFCPFCVDIRATQELVFNSQCIRQRHRSSSNYQQFTDFRESRIMNEDEPGPSGMNQSFRLSGYVDVFHSDEFLTQSNSNSVKNTVSDDGIESDLDFSFNADSSKDHSIARLDIIIGETSRSDEKVDNADWNNQDDMVLAIDSDTGYDPAGMTEVTQYRWCEHRRKVVTKAQKRLAEAIGLDPLTGRQIKQRRNERRFPSNYMRRKPLSVPMLSVRNGDDLQIPVETLEETDLITSIMFEQAKTLALVRYQRILRDGTIDKTEQTDSDENVSMYSASSSHTEAKEKRKRRPSRWGTPTTSKNHDTIITASIPLPLGPPLTQSAVSLENIPVPSTDQQPSQSQVALLSRPSALNTAPSTSFALKSAAISSFGMASGQPPISLAPFAGSGLGQQPLALSQQSLVNLGQQQLTGLGQQTLANLGQQSVPGLNQSQLASIGQGSLVQMQPSLLSNFFLPPLNLGSMNGLLAAGLLANNNPLTAPPITQPLAQSSSATAPFMLNPVQLSAASAQQLNQHFMNLATTLRRNVDMAADSAPQQPPKQPEGVPPPPAASNVRPLCDSSFEDGTTKIGVTVDDNMNNVVLCDDSKAGESGRKSASADDEETGEAVKIKKFHKSGAMFEEARRMLSSSLKKIYRNNEKGVTALSQRTKLDQRKVDEYAAKYVDERAQALLRKDSYVRD